MDDFVSIFKSSVKELGSSPVLLIAGFVVGILSIPMLANYGQFDETAKAIAIDYSQILLPLLIMPFITGGALGYAVEVRQKGSSSLQSFINSAVKNYAKMLIGGIISYIAFYLLFTGILVTILAGGLGDPFIMSLLGTLSMLLTFLVLMAIEFYDISIVAESPGIIQAYKNSINFVRRNLASAVPFFIILLILKALVQMPLSFGMAGSMMSNETYYTALMGANSTLNSTAMLNMAPVTMGPTSIAMVAVFQVTVQGFVFAFLALYKTEFYLSVKGRKRITDFDYQFSEEMPSKL